jgi:branched-chain amino acid aminotransferase
VFTYVNGAMLEGDAATVPVLDHGFLYGDGVFEGISIDGGRIFRLEEHLERLQRSASYIRIVPPGLDVLREAVVRVVAVNNLREGYVRPILTRGTGPMGITFTSQITVPNFLVIPQVRPRLSDEERLDVGLRACVLGMRRTPPECLDPRIKSNNYLNQILGKLAAADAGAQIGIMLDTQGFLSEGTGENLFLVREGVLRTPPPHNVLNGITRQTVIELAGRAGIEVQETALTTYDLFGADEVFITATLSEIAALTVVEGRTIGRGTAGAVTRRLLEDLRTEMAETGYQVDFGE